MSEIEQRDRDRDPGSLESKRSLGRPGRPGLSHCQDRLVSCPRAFPSFPSRRDYRFLTGTWLLQNGVHPFLKARLNLRVGHDFGPPCGADNRKLRIHAWLFPVNSPAAGSGFRAPCFALGSLCTLQEILCELDQISTGVLGCRALVPSQTLGPPPIGFYLMGFFLFCFFK